MGDPNSHLNFFKNLLELRQISEFSSTNNLTIHQTEKSPQVFAFSRFIQKQSSHFGFIQKQSSYLVLINFGKTNETISIADQVGSANGTIVLKTGNIKNPELQLNKTIMINDIRLQSAGGLVLKY